MSSAWIIILTLSNFRQLGIGLNKSIINLPTNMIYKNMSPKVHN